MMRFVGSVMLLCLAAALSGCFERTLVYTLNPDGSGKVVFDLTEPPPSPIGLGRTSASTQPDANLGQTTPSLSQDALKQFFEAARGVEAWSDLSCEILDGGGKRVRGTAYFPDVGRLHLWGHNTVRLVRDNDGNMLLEMDPDFIAREMFAKGAELPRPDITKEQLEKEIKTAREKYAEQREAETTKLMLLFKMDITFVLPGKIGRADGFEKAGDSNARLVFDGKKYLDGVDAYMADDEALAGTIKTGKYPSDFLSMKWFGTKDFAFNVQISGQVRPVFDYKAERDKAVAGMPALFEKLKIEPPVSATSQPHKH